LAFTVVFIAVLFAYRVADADRPAVDPIYLAITFSVRPTLRARLN